MAERDQVGASETTPLMQSLTQPAVAGGGSSSSSSSNAEPTLPASAMRSKAPRSVTFNVNPVSQTFETETHYSSNHVQPRGNSSAGRQPLPYPLNTSTSSYQGGSFSAGTGPVLSSLNNKLRRRNSHGSTPIGGGLSPHTYLHTSQHGQAYPAGLAPKLGPQRSTKNAQKLKLLPNTDPTGEDDDEAAGLAGDEAANGRDVYSQYMRIKDPSARRDAARLGKADRERLPRVTAYCTVNKYQMDALMRFLKGRGKTRGASPRLIDECIYSPYNYHFGVNGAGNLRQPNDWSQHRDRSQAPTQAHTQGQVSYENESGTQTLMERRKVNQAWHESTASPDDWSADQSKPTYAEIAAASSPDQQSQHSSSNHHPQIPAEESGYGEGFSPQQGGGDNDDYQHLQSSSRHDESCRHNSNDMSESPQDLYHSESAIAESPVNGLMLHQENREDHHRSDHDDDNRHHRNHHQDASFPVGGEPAPSSTRDIGELLDTHVHTPEVFLFEYGVVVVWGMSEAHEERFLKELEKFEVEKLATDEVQTELFNYYYTREYQPRIYNDFITLRDKTNYRTKLAISHGLAQSVKTSLFEELVATTIDQTKDIPSEIALTGTIALTRSEINMQIGELFILRINIHQSGSVLDTPELFWVEPQLEPVYQAVRSYLEMDRRVKVLTSRLDVIGDLLAVLKDQLSHGYGEKLEWIIIVLIGAEILVAAINIYVDLFIVD